MADVDPHAVLDFPGPPVSDEEVRAGPLGDFVAAERGDYSGQHNESGEYRKGQQVGHFPQFGKPPYVRTDPGRATH